jgi:hypothetical protein
VLIYAFGSAAGIARVAPAISYAIGGNDVADGLTGFSIVRCWSGGDGTICMARAERQTCISDPGFDINTVPDLGRVNAQTGADKP